MVLHFLCPEAEVGVLSGGVDGEVHASVDLVLDESTEAPVALVADVGVGMYEVAGVFVGVAADAVVGEGIERTQVEAELTGEAGVGQSHGVALLAAQVRVALADEAIDVFSAVWVELAHAGTAYALLIAGVEVLRGSEGVAQRGVGHPVIEVGVEAVVAFGLEVDAHTGVFVPQAGAEAEAAEGAGVGGVGGGHVLVLGHVHGVVVGEGLQESPILV